MNIRLSDGEDLDKARAVVLHLANHWCGTQACQLYKCLLSSLSLIAGIRKLIMTRIEGGMPTFICKCLLRVASRLISTADWDSNAPAKWNLRLYAIATSIDQEKNQTLTICA
jgi:hypothetical protein